MSSDYSCKEFVFWSVLPTGCNGINEMQCCDERYDLLLNPRLRKNVFFVSVDGMSP